MESNTKPSEPDHLHGWKAIGSSLGIGTEAARHLARHAGLPIFKLGKTVCARRSTLNAWLAEREADARQAKPDA